LLWIFLLEHAVSIQRTRSELNAHRLFKTRKAQSSKAAIELREAWSASNLLCY